MTSFSCVLARHLHHRDIKYILKRTLIAKIICNIILLLILPLASGTIKRLKYTGTATLNRTIFYIWASERKIHALPVNAGTLLLFQKQKEFNLVVILQREEASKETISALAYWQLSSAALKNLPRSVMLDQSPHGTILLLVIKRCVTVTLGIRSRGAERGECT